MKKCLIAAGSFLLLLALFIPSFAAKIENTYIVNRLAAQTGDVMLFNVSVTDENGTPYRFYVNYMKEENEIHVINAVTGEIAKTGGFNIESKVSLNRVYMFALSLSDDGKTISVTTFYETPPTVLMACDATSSSTFTVTPYDISILSEDFSTAESNNNTNHSIHLAIGKIILIYGIIISIAVIIGTVVNKKKSGGKRQKRKKEQEKKCKHTNNTSVTIPPAQKPDIIASPKTFDAYAVDIYNEAFQKGTALPDSFYVKYAVRDLDMIIDGNRPCFVETESENAPYIIFANKAWRGEYFLFPNPKFCSTKQSVTLPEDCDGYFKISGKVCWELTHSVPVLLDRIGESYLILEKGKLEFAEIESQDLTQKKSADVV